MGKVIGAISDLFCSQSQLARALNLTQPRINQLIDEGIVIRDEQSKNGEVMLLDSLQNYFLSKNTSGDGVNFWKEKGLHEKAKRELAEVKLAKTKGELYEATTVESVMGEILTNFRNRMLGLPSKYAAQLHGKNRSEIYSILTTAIEENLTELAAGLEGATFESESGLEEIPGEVDPTD